MAQLRHDTGFEPVKKVFHRINYLGYKASLHFEP